MAFLTTSIARPRKSVFDMVAIFFLFEAVREVAWM